MRDGRAQFINAFMKPGRMGTTTARTCESLLKLKKALKTNTTTAKGAHDHGLNSSHERTPPSADVAQQGRRPGRPGERLSAELIRPGRGQPAIGEACIPRWMAAAPPAGGGNQTPHRTSSHKVHHASPPCRGTRSRQFLFVYRIQSWTRTRSDSARGSTSLPARRAPVSPESAVPRTHRHETITTPEWCRAGPPLLSPSHRPSPPPPQRPSSPINP